jgi:hypothetical protein
MGHEFWEMNAMTSFDKFAGRLGVVVAMIVTLVGTAVGAGVVPKVAFEAVAFDLEDVRLLDGPFKAAMERDAAYLLTVELPPRRNQWAGAVFGCRTLKQEDK